MKTPSEAMVAAAKRGLELAEAATDPSFEVMRARARKIVEGKELSGSTVKRMATYFAEHASDRVSGWGEPGKETPGFIAWQLWGGDAGKAWASSHLKAGVVLSEDEPREFAELFFSSDLTELAVKADENGLIWKPMMVEGVWKIGPNGRPLKVIAGSSPDQRQAIGMADIVAAHKAKAVAHSTIPLTHADRVDENSGYIDDVKIVKNGKLSVLMGGHRFTDKKIKGKVEEGSIANTSVGLEFDYVRKKDGKKFPIVLRHNALTNSPWLGGDLPAFGLGEEAVDIDGYTLQCAEFVKEFDDESQARVDLWDGALTYDEIKDELTQLTDGEVTDVAFDRVLISKNDKSFVAHFAIDSGEVKLADEADWTERNVTPAEVDQNPTNDGKVTSEVPSTVVEASEVDKNTKKEAPVADEVDPKGGSKAPDPAPVTQVALSEDPLFLAEQQKNVALQAQLDQLSARDRQRDGDDFIRAMKQIGLTEDKGCTEFLKLGREIIVNDKGDDAIMLSEDGGTPAPQSVSKTIKMLLSKLPLKDGKLALQMSEQAGDPLRQSAEQKPPADVQITPGIPTTDPVQLAEKKSATDTWFEQNAAAFGGQPIA